MRSVMYKNDDYDSAKAKKPNIMEKTMGQRSLSRENLYILWWKECDKDLTCPGQQKTNS